MTTTGETKKSLGNLKIVTKGTKLKPSPFLYFKLMYLGHEYVVSSKMLDNVQNRRILSEFAERINIDLKYRTFSFVEAFPGAKADKKAFFAELEGGFYRPPESFLLRDAITLWLEKGQEELSDEQAKEYKKPIICHFVPFFGEMSFAEITSAVIKEFCSTRYAYGDITKGPMSSKRLKATMTAFKTIWNFTVKEMEWQEILDSPFEEITAHINNLREKVSRKLTKADMTSPETIEFMRAREDEIHRKNARDVLRFPDYLKGLDHLDSFYRPSVELSMLTGMISSEIAGQRDDSIVGNVMRLRWSIVDGLLRDHLKEIGRIREIPITKAIARVLENARQNRSDNDVFLFTTKTGLPFYDKPMREAWQSACKRAGIRYVSPYSFRHSFCAYCELMEIPKPMLIGLMGHADKSMIDTRYGKYVTGLEKDLEAIKEYFGEDFWNWQRPRD